MLAMIVIEFRVPVKTQGAMTGGAGAGLGTSFRIASLPPAKTGKADNDEWQPNHV